MRQTTRQTTKPAIRSRLCRWLLLPCLLMMPISLAAQDAETGTEVKPSTASEAPGPFELLIGFSRTQLQTQGFTRHEAEIEAEPFVWWSKGDGPQTLVLIHGVSSQAGSWFLVAPTLAETHRVLLVDLPGHGESGPLAGPLPMTAIRLGFETWLAEHAFDGEHPPILVGHSMGAWVAILAAQKFGDRLERLVMMNGGPLVVDTGDLNLLPKNRDEARRLMEALRDPDSPPTPDAMLDDLVRRAPTGEVSRMFAAGDDMMRYLIADEQLEEIETPIDVLWGESDRYLGAEYPRRLEARLPNARVTRIEKCGHLPQAECPQRFLEELQALLARNPPGTPEEASEDAPDSTVPDSTVPDSTVPEQATGTP